MPGDSKNRGELGEIRTQLAALSSHPSGNRIDAANAKKELFKKIINYTTVGIDMSSLFMPVMTSAVSSSEDIVLKKMLYLYICTYAQANPDLTLLTINLLTKDCRDQDPTIRGLALRSLCSLRVANLIEYLVSLISFSQRPAAQRAYIGWATCSNMRETSLMHVSMQMSPIQMGLKDAHPYVRRTAVMGVLKVYNMDEEVVQNSGQLLATTLLLKGHC